MINAIIQSVVASAAESNNSVSFILDTGKSKPFAPCFKISINGVLSNIELNTQIIHDSALPQTILLTKIISGLLVAITTAMRLK